MPITYQGGVGGAGAGATITTGAFSEAVNATDLIVVFIPTPGGDYGQTFTATDNLNSGSYSAAANINYVAAVTQLGCLYKVCNASGSAGTTTVTVGGIGAFSYVMAVHYNGFLGTATLISGDTTTNNGQSTSATGTGFNNSQTNELLVCGLTTTGTGAVSSTSSGWTARVNNGAFDRIFDQSQSTSGNAISFSNTLSPSDFWLTIIAGFYDAASIQLLVSGYSAASGLGPG